MKTITLRTLVREPLKAKRLTRAGQSITVTDRGNPLWVLQPAGKKASPDAEASRRKAINEILDGVLREKPSKFSLSRILDESRR
jgi:antitoxin (DNA-binding transcriptional repressor) of toxin-antitoxin stability system